MQHVSKLPNFTNFLLLKLLGKCRKCRAFDFAETLSANIDMTLFIITLGMKIYQRSTYANITDNHLESFLDRSYELFMQIGCSQSSKCTLFEEPALNKKINNRLVAGSM